MMVVHPVQPVTLEQLNTTPRHSLICIQYLRLRIGFDPNGRVQMQLRRAFGLSLFFCRNSKFEEIKNKLRIIKLLQKRILKSAAP